MGLGKIDIFSQEPDAKVIVTNQQLQELYELGVARGAYNELKVSKCKCTIFCEVVHDGSANGLV